MSGQWARIALVASATITCGLAAAHQGDDDQADEASGMVLDCEHLPPEALTALPQPVEAWTDVACRYTGQMLVQSRGWQWRYPASFTTPVIVPATMASPQAGGARYFTSVTVATSEAAAAAQLHQELVRDVVVYADHAGSAVPTSAYTLIASNDLGDQLRIHFVPRAAGDFLGVVCAPKCTPENTFIVQKRGG